MREQRARQLVRQRVADDHASLLADYYCVQSQLFNHATMNMVQQSRLLWKHTKRISSD